MTGDLTSNTSNRMGGGERRIWAGEGYRWCVPGVPVKKTCLSGGDQGGRGRGRILETATTCCARVWHTLRRVIHRRRCSFACVSGTARRDPAPSDSRTRRRRSMSRAIARPPHAVALSRRRSLYIIVRIISSSPSMPLLLLIFKSIFSSHYCFYYKDLKYYDAFIKIIIMIEKNECFENSHKK